MKKFKKIAIYLIGALTIFGVMMLVAKLFSASSDSSDTTQQYSYATARLGSLDMSVDGVGQLQAKNQIDLQAVAAGDAIDVVAVHVTNNQEVTEGQLLVTLDASDAEDKIYDAQLQLASAEIKLKQVEDLYDNETIDDRRQRQTQEISYKQTQKSLVDAQEDLQDYYIRAPFDGILTDLQIAAGDSISRSDVIASIISPDNELAITLNEVDALKINVGDAVSLTFDALPGVTSEGAVEYIDTIGTATSGVVTYGVVISVDEDGLNLRPGMSVNAEIAAESVTDVIVVPNTAIKSSGSLVYVQVQSDDGTIEDREITVGLSDDFYTEIKDGLAEGEKVVTQSTSTQSDTNSQSGSSLFGGLMGGGPPGGGPGM